MRFIADKQTLDDLNLTGRYKPNSIYNLFRTVHTAGGERLLDELFRHPLTDAAEIGRRSAVFAFFGQAGLSFPFDREQIVLMEDYLNGGGSGNRLTTTAVVIRKKLAGMLLHDQGFALLSAGVETVVAVLRTLRVFLQGLGAESVLEKQVIVMKEILADKRLAGLLQADPPKLSLLDLGQYDHLLRVLLREELLQVLQGIFWLDVYLAVGGVGSARGFTYARVMPGSEHLLDVGGLYHPGVEKAVANSLSLHQESNLLFLTGANMAGKSTFMKAVGITVYLAHMGFPVPAAKMAFSVLDGLYSSINVPDNLSLGYSHFYAEVLRVKAVAEAVSAGKNLLVIFDELFKGTNVKDAYDATLIITEAFAAYHNCFFIISTHIIEVGEQLREQCANLQFAYLPTVMAGMIPTYPYTLTQGITSDRHGMLIIENERIIDIIQS